jgi:hypothetical protein
VTRDLPLVVGISRLDIQTQGETRFFFTPIEITKEGIVDKTTQNTHKATFQIEKTV